MDELLTTDALAMVLGVEADQVDRWRKRYGWPHVKIGRAVRFTPVQVDEILERHTVREGAHVKPSLPGQENGLTRLSAIRSRS